MLAPCLFSSSPLVWQKADVEKRTGNTWEGGRDGQTSGFSCCHLTLCHVLGHSLVLVPHLFLQVPALTRHDGPVSDPFGAPHLPTENAAESQAPLGGGQPSGLR